MARVDFSNAVIEFVGSGQVFSVNAPYFGLLDFNGTSFRPLYNSEGNTISTGNPSTATYNQKGFTVTRTGTFTTAGTEFYIRANIGASTPIVRISNIVFNTGDTYSFDIKIDVP